MKEGPDIALLGSLIGDPARANILIALMSGKALTATELSSEAGVTLQTTSSHLKKLVETGLLKLRKQGRHRYFALYDEDVGIVLEAMMGLAAKRGLVRTRTGPSDEPLRRSRICYNHLAGELGVRVYDSMVENGYLAECDGEVELTASGASFVRGFGVDLTATTKSRRPLCKSCLDWSSRRSHLAGSLGTALLERFFELGWAKRIAGSRVIEFSGAGEKNLLRVFLV